MLKLLNSIELQAISTGRHYIDFNRDAIPEDGKLNLSFTIELAMNNDAENNQCLLILGCKSHVNHIPDGEINPLNLDITISYKFEILEPEVFFALEEEFRAKLLSSMVYLDFRTKLTGAFSSVGLSKLRFPLSLEKLKSMSQM